MDQAVTVDALVKQAEEAANLPNKWVTVGNWEVKGYMLKQVGTLDIYLYGSARQAVEVALRS